MHKSRLGGIIIDCRTDNLDADAQFWSKALGRNARRLPRPEDVNYVELSGASEEIHVEVQKVDHPSRVHIDIESDDIEAEVERLEKLGAKRIGKVRTWCVMEAPSGHRFCVVSPQRSNFENEANVWR
ncbi:MAG TPA: VOC family protein [Gammaproteobacteria bacterium]|nr:VOC family protein [Gammaproteobacteria bacterium]